MSTETLQPKVPDVPRPIAEVHDYAGLHRVLRERAEELGISRLVLDEISGVCAGYSSKVLCSPPMKNLGAVTLGPMLGALGLKLLVTEDRAALARLATRPRRQRAQARAKFSNAEPPRIKAELPDAAREYFGALGRLGAKALHASRTDEQRSAAGRRAAQMRWAKRGATNPSGEAK